MISWLKEHWLIASVILIALASSTWWVLNGRQGEKKEIPVVKSDSRILAEGIVFPVRYSAMVMPVEGTIEQVLVKEGQAVKAGQPLLRLQRQDYQARVGSTQADLAKAGAVIEQARVNLIDAERELERQQKLDKVGATSRQMVDQAKATVDRNKAALHQAEADLAAQQARITEASGQLDKTELRAPLDGTLVFLDVKPGEHASAGTVLVRIADESSWEVRSDDLTELVVAKIRVGDPAILTFDGIPGLQVSGKVDYIRPFGEKKRGDITYTVRITPDSWDERLRWNMTAQIAITPTK